MKDIKEGYIIHEVVPGKKYALCKIINEYTNEDSALDDLVDLLNDKLDEDKLNEEYLKKLKSVL